MRVLRFHGQYDQGYLYSCQVDVHFWFPPKVSFATGSTVGEKNPSLDQEKERRRKRKEKDYLKSAEILNCSFASKLIFFHVNINVKYSISAANLAWR